ncbi:hypothetical protein AGMMS49571_11240 [Endomicrobiia bacterium]|nr:hypothetical protein AGMMS49571_11240 [Endomicrobiia bacterium]
MFNIYEDLPGILSPISESINKMLDSYPKDSAQFIMNQLLSRETDKEKNFNLLKELIPQTKGLSMQFDKTRTQTPNSFQIPPDKIIFLQKICVEKINSADKKYLINHKDLRFLLYKWKEWGGSKQLTEFINQVLESNKNTIVLVSRFISVSEEIEPRNGEIERIKKLQYLYKELSDFVNLEDIKTKLDEIKKFYPKLYEEHRNTIDLFLKGYEKSFV